MEKIFAKRDRIFHNSKKNVIFFLPFFFLENSFQKPVSIWNFYPYIVIDHVWKLSRDNFTVLLSIVLNEK